MGTKEKMQRVLVHVDERCIRLGQKNRNQDGYLRSEKCPVSRALRASGIKALATTGRSIYFKDSLALECMPMRARKAIARFDTGVGQGPFKFYVTVPERLVTRKARA